MENDTNLSKEGLLEPVLPGSITFDGSILAPLQNSYLYEESRECFAYNSAYLVNNAALQRRYSAFRAEKQESGYSEEELEESFGFLLFDDESEANKLADTGLLVGQETCTTLGDSSKGVYISKYSDCLDLKRWYDGKTGYIVLLKLTKGRVKEVTENYTQKFTPPSAGFDCHVSEQLGAVCGSTSSFLAFERTQYYMYELLDGNSKTEPCPRHVCPYAVVAFSYGKTAVSLELKEKSQEKTLFHYQPWIGQLMIESIVYDVGLKSIHGAMFPTNLPKSVKVEHAIRVSELRKTLPEAIFETSLVGEVCLDGRCFILYDVVSHEARSDLSLLIHELKEKDVALVINLDDNGFLVLLHSCHFLSYEGAETDKASALQGMFIFPDSRTVPRETKIGHGKSKVSSEVLQVLPALNYAESEMEKSPPSQHGETLSIVEKHLQNFATLFFPGLSSIPAREASMFPDQYDVPDGFPLIAPKWTEEAGARLKTYVKSPSSFQLSVGRTLELLAVGKQQRSDDHDDDVYYYISSPEETPQTTSVVFSERDVTDETDRIAGIGSFSDEEKNTRKEQAEKQKGVTAEVSEDIGTVERMDISCSLPTGPYVNTAADSERTLHSKTANAVCSTGSGGISEDPPIQFTGVALISTENENDTLGVVTKPTQNSQAEAEVDLCRKVNCTLEVPANAGNRMPDVDKEMVKEVNLTEPVSLPVTLVNQKDTLTGGCVEVQPQLDSDGPPQTTLHLKLLPRRRGRRKKRGLKRKLNERQQKPVSIQNTTSPSCSSLDVSSEQSSNSEIASSSTPPQNKDWRSLPRRKRHWEANTSVKRMLRSDVKANDAKSLDENIDDITEHDMTSTPKRKMEGCNMKERYGLKTIVTDCGRIFVPHGSDAAPGDVKSQIESKDDQDPSVVPANSPTEKPSTPTSPDTHAKSPTFEIEKSGQHVPLTVQNIPVITSSTTLSSQQATVQAEKDDPSHNNSDKSLDSDLQPTSTQKCKAKKGVYRAISISKLKTVLKRAKMTKSPGSGDDGKSLSDNGEPEVKKGKANTDVDLTSDGGNSSPHKDAKDQQSVSQDNFKTAGNPEPTEHAQSKQTIVSWRELKTSPSQITLTKENGCIILNTSPLIAVVNQADHQLISTLIGDRAGGDTVSSDGKSCKESLSTGAAPPSDALNLLADLALSANSDKMANLGEKPRQDPHVGAKTSSSPESVLHALLQGSPAARLKLPPKSPYPAGLVVAGNWVLDISEEHSYSQPTSLLSGLSGTCPQVPPPVGCIESLLSVNPGLLKLPNQTSGLARQDKGGKNGWKYPTSLRLPPSSDLKSKVQESTFLHHRCICEKEGSIRVTRLWRENYDFRFDSKFTNVKLDKTVTRALHGKWDFGIEDNYEQVHLIFHMWIGLFYSKSTSRFFHFEQNCPPLDVNTSQSIDSLQTATPLPNAGSSTDEDRCTSVLRGPDILDLSVKASGPESHRTVSQGNGGEDQPKVSGKRLLPEHQTERKKQAVRAISIVSLTDSTVDDLDGDSVPENDEYSDIESDSTTKTSYTKLLENNSAYSHLCEQTLSMRIDEQQKSLTAQKNEPVFKNRGLSEALGIKSAGKTTSGSLAGLDPKALAVFHQVVGPAKPVIHSKMLDQVQGRKKIILKSLSFKEKYGDRTPTPVSKDEGHETALCGKSKGSAPVFVPGGGNKDEAASETQVVHGSASSVAVRGGNDTAKLEVKSLLDTSSDVPVNACNENSKAPEEVEHAQAETTETLQDEIKELIGPAPDLRPVLDIGDDMLANSVRPQTVREVNVTKDEVKPEHDARSDSPANAQDVNDVHDGDTCDDTPGDVKDVNYTEDEVTSVHSIRDNRPIDVLDVNQPAGITTVHSVQTDRPTNIFDINKAAKDEITAVQSVSDDIPVDVQDVCETNDVVTPVQSVSDDIPVDVQDVCETNNVVTPVQSVSDDIPVDVQNVNDSEGGVTALHSVSDITTVQGVDDETKELDKPKSDVRDCGSANEHPANEHPDVDQRAALAVDEVRKSDDVKEHMVETNENKTHEEEEELHCNDTNAETVSEKQEHTNDMQHVLALKKDSTYIADVETSDKSLKEISGSGAETLDEHVTSLKEDETAELHEQEVAAVTSLVNSRVEKSGDYAQPEIPKYSSAGCVSSDACMFSLKEGHSSPEVSDILTENDKSIMFDPSPVIQNKTPKINQLEPKEAHSDASSCFAAVNQEICTDRKHLVPTVSESLADTQDVSTPAVRVDSDVWMTSRSSTPTQDELPYTQEVCEDLRIERGVGNLQDSHSSEQTLNTVSRSPTIAESALDRSVCLNASTERHISSSMCYKVQIFPQSPHWSNNKYEATGDLTEEPKPLTQKHVPKQNFRHLVQETISSQELASKESQSQKYQYGHFSQQYGERSSELSSWAHSSSFKTDGPRRPRERYAGGQDSEIFPTHFSNSDHRDFTYMPKETIENESDIPGWVRQFHNTDAKSTVLESNERAFRHRSDLRLSESNEESESQGMGSICYSRKKFKKAFSQDEWDGEDFDGVIDYSIKKTFSCGVERTKALKTHTYCPYQRRGESRQTFDWRRYFRREGVFKSSEGNERFVHDPPSSIVTVFDKKGNRVIFENPCTLKRSVGTHSMSVQDSFHHWEDRRSKSDITQSLVELEHLIFSEKITQMLKNCKATSKAKTQHIPKVENNMTIRFSRLKEEDTITAFDEMQPTLPTLKINVDMSERKGMRKITDCGRPLHLQSLFCERGNVASCSRISNITKECTRSYNTMMNDVCAGKTIPPLNAKIRRKCDIESATCNKQSGFCGRIKKDMFDHLHDNLNSIVRQACKIKYKFYILVTSSDTFFEETKDLLEAEGHTAVEPYQFDIDGSGQTPLLILLRNEDIAEHICEVPYLLELKKSSRVLFAGIDRPDDVVNLTHQELFAKGGFVVFDEAALDALNLENMKKVVSIMEELDQKGKWKWFLHYRDSRKLRENARCSPDAQKKKHFLDCCQEAGIVEVLPYHECDVISRDIPDYLHCLVRLQIQNVSARFPVFITDTPADSFGKNGILTMNIYTFSRILSNDTCSIS
ncbi:uncharacterized protein tasor2 isoform X2 [Brachyhypopomus gauderio]|uniref:uncharacterized protein tasor2 isoform X2 n=1 Tax=Brachyhypopomus gauderio TaxID=698409 RepID=UPI00404332FE